MSSGYEKSPDYGGPPPGWGSYLAGAAIVIVLVIALILGLAI